MHPLNILITGKLQLSGLERSSVVCAQALGLCTSGTILSFVFFLTYFTHIHSNKFVPKLSLSLSHIKHMFMTMIMKCKTCFVASRECVWEIDREIESPWCLPAPKLANCVAGPGKKFSPLKSSQQQRHQKKTCWLMMMMIFNDFISHMPLIDYSVQ